MKQPSYQVPRHLRETFHGDLRKGAYLKRRKDYLAHETTTMAQLSPRRDGDSQPDSSRWRH